MNIRYAVICERLRAHARVEKLLLWSGIEGVETEIVEVHSEVTEEQLVSVEQLLGFRLPEMLRALYLENVAPILRIKPLDDLAPHVYNPVQTKSDDSRRYGLAPELVETLRQHPGYYFALGEDVGIPLQMPDRFVQLVPSALGGDPGVMMDGHTGHLYFDEFYIDFDLPDHEWSHMSFAAPSVEDWLERGLDGGSLSHVPFQPQSGVSSGQQWRYQDRKVRVVREGAWLRLAEPRPDLELTLPTLDHTDPRDETQRLREETLGDAGPDPLDKAVDHEVDTLRIMASKLPEMRKVGLNENGRRTERLLERYEKDPGAIRNQFRQAYSNDIWVGIKRDGWRVERLRHELLREMYALMEVLETEQEELREEGEEDLPLGEEGFLAELRLVIEADAQLVQFTERIKFGISQVFVGNRVQFDLPHRQRREWLQQWEVLSTSGRYQDADAGYEKQLAKSPGVAELWLGRAQNKQRWGQSEATAGKQQAAREHLSLAVEYAQQALALAPKNLRYAKVLASIQKDLEALDLP